MTRLIGLSGWSGAGKTTLLEKLIPELGARGVSVSTIKHAHHNFDVDRPGKDSFVHRQAGATEVLISSANRFALMHELRGAPELRLPELLPRLSPVDLVIVEGFKRRGQKDKAHFYNIAQSSLEEVRYFALLCRDLGHDVEYDSVAASADRISKMLHGLIRSLTPR